MKMCSTFFSQDASVQCFVCATKTVVVFKPCGHSVLCEACAKCVKKCPLSHPPEECDYPTASLPESVLAAADRWYHSCSRGISVRIWRYLTVSSCQPTTPIGNAISLRNFQELSISTKPMKTSLVQVF